MTDRVFVAGQLFGCSCTWMNHAPSSDPDNSSSNSSSFQPSLPTTRPTDQNQTDNIGGTPAGQDGEKNLTTSVNFKVARNTNLSERKICNSLQGLSQAAAAAATRDSQAPYCSMPHSSSTDNQEISHEKMSTFSIRNPQNWPSEGPQGLRGPDLRAVIFTN